MNILLYNVYLWSALIVRNCIFLIFEMDNFYLYVIALFCIQTASSQFHQDTNPDIARTPNTRTSPNLADSLINGLGELIVNIDETFSRHMSPKIELEHEIKRVVATTSPFREYLNQIRRNYGDLQRRLGSTLQNPSDVSLSSDIVDVNVQNGDAKSFVDISLPFLPFKLSINSKNPDKDMSKSDFASDLEVSGKLPDLELRGEKLADSKSKHDPSSIPSAIQDPDEIQMRSSKRHFESGSTTPPPTEIKTLEDEITVNSGKIANPVEVKNNPEDSKNSGRILGEIMYSESVFDKFMKRVIKDHGKWALDSDLHPARIIQRVSKLLNLPQEISQPAGTIESKNSDAPRSSKTTNNNIDEKTKLGESIRNEIETLPSQLGPLDTTDSEGDGKVHKPDVVPEFSRKSGQIMNSETNQVESILLAFTPEGVPLKLRMGPEIINPVKYLHTALSDADVSLNVPVDSNDNFKPVGSEILQLGSGSRGLQATALYVDLSHPKQLRAFLKTLRKIKAAYKQ